MPVVLFPINTVKKDDWKLLRNQGGFMGPDQHCQTPCGFEHSSSASQVYLPSRASSPGTDRVSVLHTQLLRACGVEIVRRIQIGTKDRSHLNNIMNLLEEET